MLPQSKKSPENKIVKKLTISAINAFLPQGIRNKIFHLGFNCANDEFLKFAYEYAYAPSMERGLRALSKRGLKPECIVDVGAFEGNWSALAHGIWPDAKIVMLEANDEKAPILEPKALAMGADLEIALIGPREGQELVFHVMESGSSVLEEHSTFDRKTETKVTRHLDGVLNGRKADLLKLDVQGFELEVLRGGEDTLRQAQAVLMEVSLIEINEGAPLCAEVVTFMRERGFEVCDILEIHRRLLDQATNQIDVLFVPKTSSLLADTRFNI